MLRLVRNQIVEAMAHRYYDYPALSRSMASEAKARGGAYDWLVGCSFIAERPETRAAGSLFVERYDDIDRRSFDVPQRTFAVSCRAKSDQLCIGIDRDAHAWPTSNIDLPARFSEVLALVVGHTPFVRASDKG
jgi:hypothetical protein